MKGRGGCVRSFGHEHDFCQAEEAEKTDPRTNYAVKYAIARGHLRHSRSNSQIQKVIPVILGATPGLRGPAAILSLRAQRLKKFKILKFSSEIENFKRATHQTPTFFVGNSEGRD